MKGKAAPNSALGKLDAGRTTGAPKAGTKPLNVAKPATTSNSPGDTGMEAAADAHTLIHAAKIKADKKRHKAAKAHLQQMKGHIASAMSDGDADDQGNALTKNVGNYGV